MARLLGPDPNSLFVYTLPGGDVFTAAGLVGTVYSDDAGTVLADIATFVPSTPTIPGPVITSSQVTVTSESLLPFFWFPASGQEELWITVNGGPLTRIVADLEDQILSGGGGGVPTTRAINTTAPLAGGGTLAADLTLSVAVGTTAGTVAAGDDARIVGALQAANNLSDLVTPATARTNLGLGGAAVLNVGTTAGTVAAGDDSRITGAVPSTRTLTAGTGLTGGGDLSANRTFTVSYGTSAGTSAQGNDTRITGALQAANNLSDLVTPATARTNLGLGGAAVLNVGTTAGTVAAGDDSRIVAAVPNTRTVTAGTGLTGGGDLSANRTFTVAYGTSAATATEGNDTRVVNAVQTSRTLTAGTGLTGGGDLSANRTFTVSYGSTSGTAAQGNDTRFDTAGDGYPRASDSGYLQWSGPLFLHNNSLVMATHTYYLGTIRNNTTGTANSVNIHFQGAGTVVTDFRIGLYGPTGTLLAKTGNGSATVGTGLKQFALTSAATLAAGKMWFVLWTIATVGPTVTATTNTNGSAAQNDPTPAGTQVRVTGSVSDGGAGTDVPASLTVAGGGNVTAPAFAQTGQQMWAALVA